MMLLREFIETLLFHPLFQTSMFAGFAIALICGVMGSYIVVKRLSLITGTIAHSVLGGAGCAIWLNRVQGFEQIIPLYGALVASIFSAVVIGYFHLYSREREDAVMTVLWSVGMSLGILFISQTPGFNVELHHFLVGNLLWTSQQDLWILLGLDVLVVIASLLFHRAFVAICFDEEHARLRGLPVKRLYFALLVLIAVSVVLVIHVVGIILVMTLLTVPAAIANRFTQRFSTMMFVATILCLCFFFFGMFFSFSLDLPPGATIALLSGASYLATIASKK